MKRFAAVSILIVLFAAFSASALLGAEPNGKRLNLNLKEVPFPEVIRIIFAGSKTRYSVDPALSALKVSASLKNVTRDQAIKVVTRTAGVVYSLDGGAYKFRPGSRAVTTVKGPAQGHTRSAKGPVKVDLVTLSYISSGDAASLMSISPPDGLVSVTATSANTLLVKGDAEAIEQAKHLIELFDVEAALPRAVRVVLSLKLTAYPDADSITLTAESVGAEGVVMPLNISHTNADRGSYSLDARVTPTVLPDGSVSVVGSGAFDLRGPGDGTEPQRLSKEFDVAASVTPGVSSVISSGSVEDGGTKLDFAASVTVTVEKGRVVVPKSGLSSPTASPSVRVPRGADRPTSAASKPDDTHRKAADAILSRIWAAEPGQPKFDAIDAVVASYRSGDLATRNAIAWLCLTYTNDLGRGVLDRWPCMYVLSRSGYEAAVPDFIEVLKHDPVEAMRAVAAEALGDLSGNPRAHDALVEADLTETSKWVREVIARRLNNSQ